MSAKQKQELTNNTVKDIVLDQLAVSEPASLGISTILKGVQCRFVGYSQRELLDVLNDMAANHELLKLIDVESGVRFKLITSRITSPAQEDVK